MKKRILAIISILILCVLAFNACGIVRNGKVEINTNTSTDSDLGKEEEKELPLNINSVQVEVDDDEAKIEIIIRNFEGHLSNAEIVLSNVSEMKQNDYIVVPEGVSSHSFKFSKSDFLIDQPEGVTDERYGIIKIEVKNSANEIISNTVYTSYSIMPQGKILMVYGDSTQLSQIEAAGDKIDLSRYDVKAVGQSQFPRSLEKMLEYDEIVFLNVDFTELSSTNKNAIENIERYVKENGRGVLFTLGDNVVSSEDGEFIDSPIYDILPVTLQKAKEEEEKAVVIIIELSHSMKELVENSGAVCTMCGAYYNEVPQENVCLTCQKQTTYSDPTRYHVALESIKNVVTESKFEPDDYIGVIVFDQDYHVALEIQQIGDDENRQALCQNMAYEFEHYYYSHYIDNATGEESDIRINFQRDGLPGNGNKYVDKIDGEEPLYSLPTSNYQDGGQDKATGDYIKSCGTSYKWPVQEASAMLARASNITSIEIKQIVLMSDGAPNDKGSGYEGIVERMAKGGTVTSTIALCISEDDQTAIQELEKIASNGKGDFYTTDTITELEVSFKDIIESMISNEENKSIDAQPMRDSLASIAHEGVQDYDMIHGYYGSYIKENAERVIYVERLRPLYAEWEYGNGFVSVLTTDLGNPEWTGEMFDDTDGIKNTRLIQNILEAPIRKGINRSGIDVEYSQDAREVTIKAYTNTHLREERNENITFKDVIKAEVYRLDGRLSWDEDDVLRENIDVATAIAEGIYRIEFPKTTENDIFLVKLKICKTVYIQEGNNKIYLNVDYETHNDDPLKDEISFIITPNIRRRGVENNEENSEQPSEPTYRELRIMYATNKVKKDDMGFVDESSQTTLLRTISSLGHEVIVYNSSFAPTCGYDLYIYDGIIPTNRAYDGPVWYIDMPEENEYVDIEVVTRKDAIAEGNLNGYLISKSNIVGEIAQKITKNVNYEKPIIITSSDGTTKSIKATTSEFLLLGSVDYSEGRYYCNIPSGLEAVYNVSFFERFDNEYKEIIAPAMMAGEMDDQKVIITTFDFLDSTLPVFTSDFPVLVINMINYSMQ